jgi:outer membrane protein assembly factor BamB
VGGKMVPPVPDQHGLANKARRWWAAIPLASATGVLLLVAATWIQTDGVKETSGTPRESGAWTTFAANPSDPSVNSAENLINASSVSRLHRIWSVKLPDLADERPIFVPNLIMADGKQHDVIYVTTDKGTLMARDAATGAKLWATTPKSDNPKYTKASPAADSAHNMVYSYGLDGKVHRFRATTGQELPGGGWPVLVTKMPLSEKVSSALNLYRDYLYVTTASFSGDAPPFQGHVVAVNVKTGVSHVWNSLCSDHDHVMALNECPINYGGIWGRPGVSPDPVTGNIFLTVSDGYFTANQGGHDWGDTVVELTPDVTRVVDSYTPDDYAEEAFQNRDMGSTEPALLPAIPKSRTPYLAIQAGKEGLIRLINRQDLSGQHGPSHVGGSLQTLVLPDQAPTLSQPLTWRDSKDGSAWVFVPTMGHIDAFRAVTSAQGVTRLQKAWYQAIASTSPIIAGNVLFTTSSTGGVQALDPRTGHELWRSDVKSAGGSIGHIHWEAPIVVGGRLYVTDESSWLTAYGIRSRSSLWRSQ